MWAARCAALALALGVIGTLQPTRAAALAEGRARPTRAAEHWLALIAEIARIGAISEQTRSENSVAVGATINSILLKPEAGNNRLHILVVPVPVPDSRHKSGSQIISTAPNIASLLTSLVTSPVRNNNAEYEYKLSTQTNSANPRFMALSPNLNLPPANIGDLATDRNINVPISQIEVSAPISGSKARLLPTVSRYSATRLDTPVSTPTPLLAEMLVLETSATGSPLQHLSLPQERRVRSAINFPPVDDSQKLVQQFHEQVPRSPSLPPVVTEPLVLNTAEDEVMDVPEPGQDESRSSAPSSPSEPSDAEKCLTSCQQEARGGADAGLPAPPLPRFERTMMLEAVLTVPRADYSEPYTLWWDAASGAYRLEHHDGTASTYRIMRLDGRVQSVHVRVDRTGEADVRRCTLLAPRRVTLAERALPVLPDLSGFTFAGYVEVRAGPEGAAARVERVERWLQATAPAAGAGGAARGELLTFRHELLVARAADNLTTTPLRYAVAVDSSILGANCDSYVHRFFKVYTRHYDAATFSFDVGDACDYIENADDIQRVEPLREFAMLQRDPTYDEIFERFKREYQRRYADDVEEAVRKNVLIQSSRFVSSGNRKGASFELEANFVADRLKVELEPLHGVEDSEKAGGTDFPYSKVELRRMRGRLPRTFDWRERGGVTPVRNQSLCSACWAFSVVGAVEGALFANTGRLVALSEQSLVDCGHRSGAHGCRPTWPSFAYDYVRDNGLPALDEYNPYVGKVQQCDADRVAPVTRISGHLNVTAMDLLALKVAIRRHGPTVVLVDGMTDSLYTYKGGFYYDAKCKKNSSNHAVLAVGWTVHRGEPYFILKNWWTTGWGQDGYIYMRGRPNTCGLLRRPSLPLLRRANVLRVPATARVAHAPPTAS